MYSIVLPDAIEAGIQDVYWTILIIFLVLAVSSWLVASKDWFKEGMVIDENTKEPGDESPDNALK